MNLMNPKLVLPIVLVVVIGVFGYFLVSYIQDSEETKIELKLQEDINKTRKDIKDALESNAPVDRNDATDSLQWLSDRD